PFYWGQDRFGMLLPLLAMPVRQPVLNMVVQGFLSTVAVLLAPFLVARFLSRDHWFAIGALTNVALLLVASREVQFDWFCNQPYGWVELRQTSRAIVAHPVSLIVLGVVAVCVTLLLLYRIDRDPVVLSCIAVGVAVTHWLVVGASEWVRMNLYYPRYIFPSLMM